MPKFNMYQSLHTTVIGPGGKPVEMQIRTHAMHRTAEYGIAAHWKYKESKTSPPPSRRRCPTRWAGCASCSTGSARRRTRRSSSTRCASTSAPARSSSSPRRATSIALPAGSTPVDFAYAVHTEVGHRCIGARVNGRLVPLESALDNGDIVEVFTSKAETAGPRRDWLAFVKSPRARNKIRQWFAKERREDAIDEGKDAISRAMRKPGLPMQRLLGGDALLTHRPATCTWPTSPRCTPRSARATSPRSPSCSGSSAQLGGPEGAVEDIAETDDRPTRADHATGAARRRPGRRGQGRRATSGSSSPAAARRCPATRSSASSPAATASPCTARTAPTSRRLLGAAGPAGRGRVGAVGGLGVPGRDPGRGARPAPAALRRHPGAVRRARQHPVGVGHHHPRPGRGQPVHLRDGRPEAPRPPAARVRSVEGVYDVYRIHSVT